MKRKLQNTDMQISDNQQKKLKLQPEINKNNNKDKNKKVEFIIKSENIINKVLTENDSVPNPSIALGTLHLLKSQNLLDRFLKQTNYYAFNWAIRNLNMEIFDYIFDNLRPEHHLLMFIQDDYESVKELIKYIALNLAKLNGSVKENLVYMLKKITKVDKEVADVVINEININCEKNKKIEKNLQSFLNEIIDCQVIEKENYKNSYTSKFFSYNFPVNDKSSCNKNSVISNSYLLK